jgi:1-deoxy-D-xylulose-5-phosphate reductoisomerase
LKLALEAGRAGGNAPTVLNAANEVAVGSFLAGKLSFTQISEVIAAAMDRIPAAPVGSFEDVLATHRETVEYIKKEFAV